MMVRTRALKETHTRKSCAIPWHKGTRTKRRKRDSLHAHAHAHLNPLNSTNTNTKNQPLNRAKQLNYCDTEKQSRSLLLFCRRCPCHLSTVKKIADIELIFITTNILSNSRWRRGTMWRHTDTCKYTIGVSLTMRDYWISLCSDPLFVSPHHHL